MIRKIGEQRTPPGWLKRAKIDAVKCPHCGSAEKGHVRGQDIVRMKCLRCGRNYTGEVNGPQGFQSGRLPRV